MRKTKTSFIAWLLTLAMILTGVTLPSSSQRAQAADTLNLSVQSGSSTTSLTMAKNQWNSDYIGDILFDVPDSINTKSKVASQKPVVSISLTVNTIGQDTGTLNAMIYTQDSSYNWNQCEGVGVTAGSTIELVYDLTQMEWSKDSLANIGFRFADDSVNTGTITYTINSAKVTLGSGTGSTDTGSSSSSSSGTTDDGLATDAQVSSSEVSVTATADEQGQYWVEYSFTVTNHTSQAITGVQVVLPTPSGEPTSLQGWGVTYVYNSDVGGVILYSADTIAAGASITLSKIGFTPSGTVGTAYVRGYNCDAPTGSGTSSSDLNYELTGQTKEVAYEDTPFGKHGKLSLAKVDGYGNAPVLVDKNNKPFQLRGASTHGIQWGEMKPYVNKGAFQSLRDEWGVNMVRLAGYVTQGGYTQGSSASMDETFQKGVAAATELGMYVIIDWHIHAEDPNATIDQSKEFFTKYATMYKDYDNVIFEICNEPTGVVWYNGSGSDLYSYCKTIAGVIRDCGSESIIVCGTNTWSQDVDDVVNKPLKDDGFDNIMYTFHFYSGSHYSDKMAKVKQAVSDGTPIFVTEFGICDANGNGGFDTSNADAWIELLDSYNISYACWSLCNKNESASYLSTSCTKTEGGWTSSDLATTGVWLVNTYRKHQDAEEGTDISVSEGSEESTGQTTVTQAPGDETTDDQTTATQAPGDIDIPAVETPTVETPGDSTATDTPATLPDNPSDTDAPGEENPSHTIGTTTPPATVTDSTVTQTPGDTAQTPGDTAQTPEDTAQPTGDFAEGSTSQNPTVTAVADIVPAPTDAVGNVSSTQVPTQTPVVTAAPTGSSGSVSYLPEVTATAKPSSTSTVTIKKATIRLKKSVIRIKKGKKARILIRKKTKGDTVKKYTISGKKNIVSVTKNGVVKGRKKGIVRVKVVMKSGASAWCRIIVRN